jgi:uroporphyrinogen-III synthase
VRADKGRDVLRRDLEALGHHVEEAVAYESRPLDRLDPETAAAIDRLPVSWITLTSSSIAEAAVRLFGDRLARWRIASISPVTTAALERLGAAPTVEAAEATSVGLVDAICRWEASAAAVLHPPAESPGTVNLPPSFRE